MGTIGSVFDACMSFNKRARVFFRSCSALSPLSAEVTLSNPLTTSSRKVFRRCAATTLARWRRSLGKSIVVFIEATFTGVCERYRWKGTFDAPLFRLEMPGALEASGDRFAVVEPAAAVFFLIRRGVLLVVKCMDKSVSERGIGETAGHKPGNGKGKGRIFMEIVTPCPEVKKHPLQTEGVFEETIAVNHSSADELRPVFGVEELALGFVETLVGVGPEEIALGLQKVGRQALGAVAVVIGQRPGEARGRDAIEGS